MALPCGDALGRLVVKLFTDGQFPQAMDAGHRLVQDADRRYPVVAKVPENVVLPMHNDVVRGLSMYVWHVRTGVFDEDTEKFIEPDPGTAWRIAKRFSPYSPHLTHQAARWVVHDPSITLEYASPVSHKLMQRAAVLGVRGAQWSMARIKQRNRRHHAAREWMRTLAYGGDSVAAAWLGRYYRMHNRPLHALKFEQLAENPQLSPSAARTRAARTHIVESVTPPSPMPSPSMSDASSPTFDPKA